VQLQLLLNFSLAFVHNLDLFRDVFVGDEVTM
jgi:hypothetical protein